MTEAKEAETAVSEMTLDEMRPHLVEAMLPHVAFDGWSDAALALAARELGVPPEAARLAFPRGAIDMVDAYVALADQRMKAGLESVSVDRMKIRERIETAILTRLEQALAHREAVRKAVLVLARPDHAARAARIAWRTADSMWVAIGDTSRDFSWYSKRAILSSVYAATLLVWLDDQSEDFTDTRGFLERRIANVMQIEKAKAKFRGGAGVEHFSLSRFLGRLRYPVDG